MVRPPVASTSRSGRGLEAHTGEFSSAVPVNPEQGRAESQRCRARSEAHAVLMGLLRVFIRPYLLSPSSPDTQSQSGSRGSQLWVRPWGGPGINQPPPQSGQPRLSALLSLLAWSPPSFALKNLIRPAEEPPGRTAGPRDRNSQAQILSLSKPLVLARVGGGENGTGKGKFRPCPWPHETLPSGPRG